MTVKISDLAILYHQRMKVYCLLHIVLNYNNESTINFDIDNSFFLMILVALKEV